MLETFPCFKLVLRVSQTETIEFNSSDMTAVCWVDTELCCDFDNLHFNFEAIYNTFFGYYCFTKKKHLN